MSKSLCLFFVVMWFILWPLFSIVFKNVMLHIKNKITSKKEIKWIKEN